MLSSLLRTSAQCHPGDSLLAQLLADGVTAVTAVAARFRDAASCSAARHSLTGMTI